MLVKTHAGHTAEGLDLEYTIVHLILMPDS